MSAIETSICVAAWEPKIGDPSFMGWFTVFAYVAAALLCFFAMARNSHGRTPVSWYWFLLTCGLFLLAINKQLDLQSWFTQVGKNVARDMGWYERRRVVQAVFVVLIGSSAIIFTVRLVPWVRHRYAELTVPTLGVIFLLAFIVIRAASFHHFEVFSDFRVAGVRMNCLMELGGIGLISWGALSFMMSSSNAPIR
jgi:hypothetical protein